MSGLYGGMLKGSGNHVATCQHGSYCECSECREVTDTVEDLNETVEQINEAGKRLKNLIQRR